MRLIVLYSTFFVFSFLLVHGQNQSVDLEEVTVTDSRFERSQSKTGRSVTFISKQDIKPYLGGSMASLLSSQAGIHVNGYQSHPGTNLSYFIRGGNNRHVLVTSTTLTSVVKGVLSHLGATEDPNEKEFTHRQLEKFNALQSVFGDTPIYHVLNTSGVFNYPQSHGGMVRSGIGLYGYGNHEKVSALLQPVGVLKTVISQIHEVQTGESVGYNRGFVANKPTRSATLPIGHADGIGRFYGNGKGYVSIDGQKAAVLGNVCMDMIMVDVTNIDCEEGDDVIVFGEHGTSAEQVAEHANTISYELLTAISQRVPRVIID